MYIYVNIVEYMYVLKAICLVFAGVHLPLINLNAIHDCLYQGIYFILFTIIYCAKLNLVNCP